MNNPNPLREKSYAFAAHVAQIYRNLQENKEYILSKQLMKSGTSVGANIEEAQQAESRKDFISKLKIAMKEANESKYWLRIIRDSHFTSEEKIDPLLIELKEVTKLLNASVATARTNLNEKK